MRRARQTAAGIKKSRYVEWRALREIEVGVCDGMTYAQVRQMGETRQADRAKSKEAKKKQNESGSHVHA